MTKSTHATGRKAALAVGFLALVVAVFAAHRDPATGYELSLYAATPVAFWAGVGVALAIALPVAAFAGGSRHARVGALGLSYATVLSVLALPVLRGYRFHGSGDALSHLAWIRDIQAGAISPLDILYPGVHTTSVVVSGVTGVPVARAALYTVLAFALVYMVFVPLCVRAIVGTEWALVVGAFASLFLLPVNNVATYMQVHPTTEALFFLPVILFLVFKYVTYGGEDALSPTPVGALLGVALLSVVLVHPQQALNVVLVFVAIAAMQFVYRRRMPNHPVARHRPVYAPTAFLVVAWLLWAPRHPRVSGAIQGVTTGLLGGDGRVPGDDIGARASSLTQLGAGFEVLFAKLFLVATVFIGVAGLFLLFSLFGRYDDRLPDRNVLVKYLTVALVPITGMFGLFFAASATTQPFRYLGFAMVIVTIVVGVAVSSVFSGRRRPAPGTVGRAVSLAVVLLLPLAMLSFYASPFIYQPNQHVTEMQFQGYETTFDHRAEGVAFTGIGHGPQRYVDLRYGTLTPASENFPGARAVIPYDGVLGNNLTSYYGGDRYLPVTQFDWERETTLYDGFQYSEREFRSLSATPGINRVSTNDEFHLYLVENEEE